MDLRWFLSVIFIITTANVVFALEQESSSISIVASVEQNLTKQNKNGCGVDIKWIPEYDEDGTFSAVQCKGEKESGRCFCFSPEGSRIFGWSWQSSSKKMFCRCSRQSLRLKSQLKRNDVSLHCTENGNYETLQCDNGLCWCVEPTTGKPKERIFPQSMMKYLSCYKEKSEIDNNEEDEEFTPSHYLRQCESKALARFNILQKLEAHGRINTHIDEPRCDYDGSYANYQVEKKRVYCVWKDSARIDNYQAEVAEVSGLVNCNCARDLKIFAEEGLTNVQSCGPYGNYDGLQMSNDRPYCVDSDGFATTELCNEGGNLTCPLVV